MKLIRSIEKSLLLPNAVDIFSDGTIAVADAGNNRICRFNEEGELVDSIGQLGFGKYRFKEPVALAISPADHIYIADWHNHRVVVFTKSLSYITEFGQYCHPQRLRSSIMSIIRFYYYLSYGGTYTRYHFENHSHNGDVINEVALRERIILFLHGLHYWTFDRHNSILDSIYHVLLPDICFQKPNGITFLNDKVFITQKNLRSIKVFEKRNKQFDVKLRGEITRPIENVYFGRLGNVKASRYYNRLFVCDEREEIIWMLDDTGKYYDHISVSNLNIDTFFPFSVVEISRHKIVVCSKYDLLIIDVNEKSICSRKRLGELHGIAFHPDSNTLYVVERSNDRVSVYDIQTECNG